MREPVAIVEAIKELVRSGLTMLIAFGVWKMTQEQMGLVLVFTAALLALISVLFVRSKVFAPVSSDGNKLVSVTYENQAPQAVTNNQVQPTGTT